MRQGDCIFCKIVEGSIPSTKVFENETVVAFKDLRPLASRHYLFVHRHHSSDVNDMMAACPEQIKDIYLAISDYAKKSAEFEKGYRVVVNQGEHAGQTVFHTHFHLLGGEPLGRFGR